MIERDPLTERVIGACMEVHRSLGPGLLESTYEACMCMELQLRGIAFERQKAIGVHYKGLQLEESYRLDLLVERELILELKAIEKLLPLHEAQLLTYLKLTGYKRGLLVNFNVPLLKQGLKRLANHFPD